VFIGLKLALKRDSSVFKILQICAFLFGLFWFIGGLLIWLSLIFGVSVEVEYGTYELFGMLLLMPLGILIMFLAKKGVIEFGSD
jgi:hypothetical protein